MEASPFILISDHTTTVVHGSGRMASSLQRGNLKMQQKSCKKKKDSETLA
jgi:hypothetical protein